MFYIVKGTKVLYAFFRLIILPLSSKKRAMLCETNKVDEKSRYRDTMRYGLMLNPHKRSTTEEVAGKTIESKHQLKKYKQVIWRS
ncbi:MAG: hypothetical protein N5P05_001952 [Chroococcopsis gigantea SAG 12.99]|jgi:hypothetical protein|nr:hypothetical protein [Chroococcopsis gigantea SAG 12.99]